MRNSRQSGQAMLELLFLLIGFVSLFLGLVFVCGLSDGDIGIFLRARNNAELLASDSNSSRLNGLEFGAPRHGSYDIYGRDEELVFSPQDYTGKSANNTILSKKLVVTEIKLATIGTTVSPVSRIVEA